MAGIPMTFETADHISETTFEDHVEQLLNTEHDEDNVHRQYHFENGRIADFLVFDKENGRMEAWELENDADSLISGTGQALFYQQSALREHPDSGSAIPVLAFPEGHIDEGERDVYEAIGVQLREISVPEETSTEGV